MKRVGNIASLFARHAQKTRKKASTPDVHGTADVAEEQTREFVVQEQTQETVVSMSNVTVEQTPEPMVRLEDVSTPPSVYDFSRLKHDPGERPPIASYHVNDQDAVRRAYILKAAFKPYAHNFEARRIGNRFRSFSPFWFHEHSWLEYSIKEKATFCFVCFLFKEKKTSGKGTNAFTDGGWRNWNRDDALDKHVGGVTSVHNAAQEKYDLFVNPHATINDPLVKVDSEDLRLYRMRLKYSLRCLQFLLHQGLAFRGHDESEQSSNRGNFIELLKWLAINSEEVNKYVLKNAPGNCKLTSHQIQNQIIQCCAVHTRNQIIEQVGDDHYAILADESSDVSHKEQLALCLRFVDKVGRPSEHFLGVVHVSDTIALSLKEAIQTLLANHGLTITQIRGQVMMGLVT
ncbi:hypothetical protein VPH35_081487 [Triticum aestivum]|uniref:zinc finger MYM-type protein 1 n=1 Tax=Triticum aestivum TaxID=4565 RepID=UPI001D002C8D|nr:zinc finger MYM-type protein 1-like [Triticum aestivum]